MGNITNEKDLSSPYNYEKNICLKTHKYSSTLAKDYS